MMKPQTESTARAIRAALEIAGRSRDIVSISNLYGGCIHNVFEVKLGDGSTVVAKTNTSHALAMFNEEAHGLRALARTNTVVVPEPFGCIEAGGIAVLLMTRIDPARVGQNERSAMAQFGEDLAALHAASAGDRYGFDHDNHIGSTPQHNTWCDNWIEFNARHRIGFQVERASNAGFLTPDERRQFEELIGQLDRFIPARPKPSLLHGDLWSGNALPTSFMRGEEVVSTFAVIDPACSIGDGWCDIAMMKLFGGFDTACFEAYGDHAADRESLETRIAVYQLYHVLNHVNIFGRGYAGQAMSLVRTLLT
jgi:fructosamine-3-kinase